jgi:hypothetical protein
MNPCGMNKLYSFLFLFLLCHCRVMSQEGPGLIPQAPEGHYEQGREYIPLGNNGIEVEMGYDGVFHDYFVFDVVIVNDTRDPLLVQPADFYYLLLDNAEADTSLLPPFSAVSPSRILECYETSLEQETLHRNLNTIFGCIEAGIGIVSGATAFFASEDPGSIIDALFNTAGTAGYYVQQDRRIGNTVSAIAGERDMIREELMREGEIPPGKVFSGYVFFPEFEEPGYMMFCIPLGDQLFQFVYRQVPEKRS